MISRKIDLHIHTTHSDGTYSPAQIAAKLVQLGIGTFSFTDHDTISSLAEAEEICMAHGLHCLPGVEFTTYIDDKEVHILGYGFDRTNPAVNRLLAYFFDERLSRAKRILQKLEAYHKPLTIEEVQAEAKNAAIARPHIAMAMIKKGYVRHFYEAFDLYLGNNGVCYERKFFIEPQVIFNVIRKAGGVCLVAHPSFLPDTVVQKAIDLGIDGLEIIHPSHSGSQNKKYSDWADKLRLLKSGGSDFHGGMKNDEDNLGKFYIPDTFYISLKNKCTGMKDIRSAE